MVGSIPLFLLTYNLNKQLFQDEAFISKFAEVLPDDVANLYVFGVEEFCSVMEASFHDSASHYMIALTSLIIDALYSKYGDKDISFSTLATHHLGSIGIIAITPYGSKFDRIKVADASFGYGYSSLKGGVGIRLLYYPNGKYEAFGEEIEMTFVNMHLPAGESAYAYQTRIDGFYTVSRALSFGDGFGLLKPDTHTFVMGDLNFRTSQDYMAGSQVSTELLDLQDLSRGLEKPLEKLLNKHDELIKAREDDDLLNGFTEAPIHFNPTYKYHVNTAIYNPKRSPSWCDRIMYLKSYNEDAEISIIRHRKSDTSKQGVKVPVVHRYDSIQTILMSDHQPVFLSISIPEKAPESMITTSGYLQTLGEIPGKNESNENLENMLGGFSDTFGGPTNVYMKITRLDILTQGILRPVSDFVIGYGLWLSTTSNGRVSLLSSVLVSWALYYFFV